MERKQEPASLASPGRYTNTPDDISRSFPKGAWQHQIQKTLTDPMTAKKEQQETYINCCFDPAPLFVKLFAECCLHLLANHVAFYKDPHPSWMVNWVKLPVYQV